MLNKSPLGIPSRNEGKETVAPSRLGDLHFRPNRDLRINLNFKSGRTPEHRRT